MKQNIRFRFAATCQTRRANFGISTLCFAASLGATMGDQCCRGRLATFATQKFPLNLAKRKHGIQAEYTATTTTTMTTTMTTTTFDPATCYEQHETEFQWLLPIIVAVVAVALVASVDLFALPN